MQNNGVNENKVLYNLNQYLKPLPEIKEDETKDSSTTPSKKTVTVPIKKPVKSDNLKGYLPNIIYTPKIDISKDFDLYIENGTKFSDGSAVLKPVLENPLLKNIKLVQSGDSGKYDVVRTNFKNGSAYTVVDAVLTEQQVKENPYLYAGQIKKVGDNQYEITHYNDKKEPVTEVLTLQECLNIMKTEGCSL